MAARSPVAETLASRTVPAADALVETLADGRLRCYACGHRCPIPEGREGVCRVRFRENGTLASPGATSARCSATRSRRSRSSTPCPGSDALSFGMLGCDLHCAYCQNWFTSQSIRDPEAVGSPRDISAAASSRSLPSRAGRRRSSRRTTSRSSRRNGPSRSSAEARRRGSAHRLRLQRQRHAAGPRLHPPLGRLLQGRPEVDGRQALPAARRASSRTCSRRSRGIHERGIWLEVLTLVIPGFNDSEEELTQRGAVRRLDLARHPVARDGVSSRLQDDRPGRDAGRDPAPRRARSGRPRACATSTRETSRAGWGSGRTRAAPSARPP